VPAKLEELLAGIGAAIDAVGGSFTMRYTGCGHCGANRRRLTGIYAIRPWRGRRNCPQARRFRVREGRTPVRQSGVRTAQVLVNTRSYHHSPAGFI
jgi:hypothetical protein